MNRKYWKIEGYEGQKKVFETQVKYGYFSENKIKCLLKAMAAKAGLNYDEMVVAYSNKDARISSNLLEVQRDNSGATLSCGTNPYFTARVVNNEDL
jgi:hypothetical protein